MIPKVKTVRIDLIMNAIANCWIAVYIPTSIEAAGLSLFVYVVWLTDCHQINSSKILQPEKTDLLTK